MTRRSGTGSWAIAAIAIAVAVAAWWGVDRARTATEAPGPSPAARAVGRDPVEATAARGAPSAAARMSSTERDGDVTITGKVIDISQQQPVANVEVVFRSTAGENTTTTRRDGSYSIRIAPGSYRAFVRDDTVLSIGRPDLVRLPSLPSAETAGIPDEALMATVVAHDDIDGVDLNVVRGGVVSGRVIDRNGRPIGAAVLRARGSGLRPTLATDVAESDATGNFELRLPAGSFQLDVSHPRFAGVASVNESRLAVSPGEHVHTTITLVAGCVISGRVVGPDGKPASDGAIEKQWGEGVADYTPAGRVEPDGTFRWVTTDEVDVTLRAWPWKAPPSAARRFACRDGARFQDVVLQLPERRPDIEGVLVDKAGEPVGFAFVDLAPLDRGGIAQQERTDASGHWQVFSMPPGRYRITAQAEGRGVAISTIVSPRDGVRLELGGTGRLEGTTTRLASGSFELVVGTCVDRTGMVPLPQSRRLVTVTGGRFTVDDLPACELSFGVSWRGRLTPQHLAIPSGGTAHIELDLGTPRAKTVHGLVRDGTGKPIAGAIITSSYQGKGDTVARTDAGGAYTIKTFSGAALRARAPGRVGFAQVGAANVDAEQVDLVVVEDGDDETDD
jgi:hypothetical protein